MRITSNGGNRGELSVVLSKIEPKIAGETLMYFGR